MFWLFYWYFLDWFYCLKIIFVVLFFEWGAFWCWCLSMWGACLWFIFFSLLPYCFLAFVYFFKATFPIEQRSQDSVVISFPLLSSMVVASFQVVSLRVQRKAGTMVDGFGMFAFLTTRGALLLFQIPSFWDTKRTHPKHGEFLFFLRPLANYRCIDDKEPIQNNHYRNLRIHSLNKHFARF